MFLEDSILYRIESHIYCLGFYLFYSSIGDSDGVGIVGLDGRDRLRVSHISECDTEHGAVVGVAEEAAGFGSVAEEIKFFMMLLTVWMAPLGVGVIVGGCVGSTKCDVRVRCPLTRLWDLGSDP